MKKLLLLSFLAIIATNPARAQTYVELYEKINDLNVIKALQNPNWERAYQMMNRSVQDRKHQGVGQIKNITMTRIGLIDSLEINFDKLSLGTVNLNLRESGLSPARDMYIFNEFDEEQLEELVPVFLSNIQTASGTDDGLISLNRLIGAKIYTDTGTKVGEVADVLFDDEGVRAEALYVKLNYNRARGQTLAIPFGAVDYSRLGEEKRLTVTEDLAKASSDFIQSK